MVSWRIRSAAQLARIKHRPSITFKHPWRPCGYSREPLVPVQRSDPAAHGEADPLRCPKCSREGASFRSIDEEDVIERILRHLGLWQEGMRVHCGAEPPGETTLDPWLNDPFPDYDTEPVMAFSAT